MRIDVLCTWNESLLFAGRLSAPVTLRQIVPALDRDDVVVDARGELVSPEDFARAPSGTSISRDGLSIRVSNLQRVAGLHTPKLGPSVGIAAASLAAHVAGLLLSSAAPQPTAEQVAQEHMSIMRRLLSVRAEAEAESAVAADDKEGGSGTRAKGEEGAMGDPRIARQAALREAAEFGIVGVLGTDAPAAPWGRADEAGGGRGDGLGFGYGHGRLGGSGSGISPAPSAPSPVSTLAHVNVRAGEWDDNADLAEFVNVVSGAQQSLPVQRLDVSRRRVIIARDSANKPLVGCPVALTDADGHTVTLRTLSNGHALFFPRAEGLAGDVTASVRCGGNAARATFSVDDSPDGTITLDGREPRDPPQSVIDVAFALDTTGSMSEEIVAVKSTLWRVASQMGGVRVGLVEYKDRGDPYVTRVFGMSSDVPRFASLVASLSASGGGDLPEAVSSGLDDAIHKLEWSESAPARLLFLIGDAPPHAQDTPSYAGQAREASHAGIQVFTVAASGMDAFGQIVFRQIAQYTGGTEMFVLRGGAGPQSVGGGDPIKSCGGTQTSYTTKNLDALIVDKVRAARRAIDADPMLVAQASSASNGCRAPGQ